MENHRGTLRVLGGLRRTRNNEPHAFHKIKRHARAFHGMHREHFAPRRRGDAREHRALQLSALGTTGRKIETDLSNKARFGSVGDELINRIGAARTVGKPPRVQAYTEFEVGISTEFIGQGQ